MGQWIQSDPPQPVCRVVSLLEGGGSMSIFVSAHGEYQHREGQHEVTELSIQRVPPRIGGRRRLNAALDQVKMASCLTLQALRSMFSGSASGAFRSILSMTRGSRAPYQIRR